MVAISQMDEIFSMNHYDKHYMVRRKNATIVVSDVQTPSAEVFAGCMGFAVMDDRNGYDVLLTRLDDGSYVVDARTGKGESCLEPIAQSPGANADSLEQRAQVWKRNEASLQQHKLNVDLQDIPILLKKLYDHPIWEKKAAKP